MKLLLFLFGLVNLFAFASASPLVAEYNVSNPLVGRDTSDKVTPTLCTWDTAQPWVESWDFNVGIAIDDLAKRGGRCYGRANDCGQIACHGDAHIVLCNDNDYDIYPDCTYLSTYADDIRTDCQYFSWTSSKWYTGGQKFDTDHYNIIVKDPKGAC
ncbi:hypothetical protein HYALB_00009122 [Hymenoscyphus albidus]|uniref:Uncharacterized protein n=1 Tax=Hymenoscyphus albidus TaxID=595503 RepID=A0A9N9LMB2_9HELO|nr:hypothetical protein HYALB_00009122 [Hymenoscyphus albidus]